MAGSEHFWKLTFAKFARLRARTIRKSKSLKHQGLGAFFEVKICFAWQAQGFRHFAKYVAGAGVRQGRKNVGRRGGFEEGLKRWVSRGRRRDFVVCDVDVWSIRRWNRGKVANLMSRKCYFAVIISRGSYRTSYASAQLFRGRRSTFEASTWKSLKRIVILRSSVCSTCQFWRKSRRNASFLKEVPQKSFVFEFQSYIFEDSLAEKLRFWLSKLHFWRKSRKKVSFLSFKATFLKEVSQKCFVFDLQSYIFEDSLAEKLRFWVSKLHFWRKSRKKVSFLSFKATFLKSRRNASFLIFKASFLKEVSHKSFVFELQSVFLEEVSQKSFVWQNHLNHTSVDNQIAWTSNDLTSKSLESQISWQPTHLNLKSIDNQIIWISDQMTTESLESQISWQPHHLKFTSTDNQNHLKHTSINNQNIWISNQLTTKSIESQINWQPKSFDSQLVWIWHQLCFEPIELRTLPFYNRFLIFGNFRHRLVR